MFEDLLGSDKTEEDEIVIPNGSPDQVCPLCGSVDIDGINGIFTSATSYFATMFCNRCNATWTVEYDTNLNIVDYRIRI